MLKCYLSALRFAQIAMSLPSLLAGASFPCLEHVLKGLKKTQSKERKK